MRITGFYISCYNSKIFVTFFIKNQTLDTVNTEYKTKVLNHNKIYFKFFKKKIRKQLKEENHFYTFPSSEMEYIEIIGKSFDKYSTYLYTHYFPKLRHF